MVLKEMQEEMVLRADKTVSTKWNTSHAIF